MTYRLLTPEMVERIHDEVLNPGELSGRARDKSLDGALARVEQRLAYGMIGDVYDLAAATALAVATGHCFNDGNKRTAFRTMQVALILNGVSPDLDWPVEQFGPLIIALAAGALPEDDFAAWLRAQT